MKKSLIIYEILIDLCKIADNQLNDNWLTSIVADSQETDCNQLDFHRLPLIFEKSISRNYFVIDSHRLWVKI